MNRREFSIKILTLTVLGFVLPMVSCGESEAIKSLRNILRAVESAITSLTKIPGLLPDVIHEIAKYLTAVTDFVEKVGEVLEDEKLSNADKASQISTLALSVVLPNIQNPTVMTILLTVHAAFNAFMTLFHSRQTQSFSLSDTEQVAMAQIETEARTDHLAVLQWAKDMTGEK